MTRGKGPILIYDGECGFCRLWVSRWRYWTQGRVADATSQESGAKFPEIAAEAFERSVQFVDSDGKVFEGAEGIFRSIAVGARWGRLPFWAYRNIGGVKAISEGCYRLVADNRRFFSRFTAWLWGDRVSPSTYQVGRWLFLKLLGACFFTAFVSFWSQLDGLIGSQGILPAQEYLSAVKANYPDNYWAVLPTLAWLGGGDAALHSMCALGAGASVLLMAGIAPIPILFLLWALYLSLGVVGQIFTGYQWDMLILETAVMGICVAPGGILPNRKSETAAPAWGIFLVHWLGFRLMLSSGWVKLASGDPHWWNLTALTFHYETTCLPNVFSWYAHQLPASIQRASTAAMFLIEIGLPFLFFAPRRLKIFAASATILFMAGIQATGNYTFFNLLTIAICAMYFDDHFFFGLMSEKWKKKFAISPASTGAFRPGSYVRAAVAAGILLISGGQFWRLAWGRSPWVSAQLERLASPFRSVNNYGLFAVMTTKRFEIVLEGSDDNETWKEYEFKWKPGDPHRAPGFAAPHQPRLDWQMWFAALSDFRSPRNRWFLRFMLKLMEGSAPVAELLKTNPFPEKPPKHLRALYYQYTFTSLAQRRESGRWWNRELKGLYAPVLSRKSR